MNDIDTLVADAVGAATARPDPPDHITPAELGVVTQLPLQQIGLRVAKLFGVRNIRGRGYPVADLRSGYLAHLARQLEQRDQLQQQQQQQEAEAIVMRERLERVKAERQELEQQQKQLKADIKKGDAGLAAELEREERELQRQQAETRRLNHERERQRQMERRMERPIPTGAAPRKGRPKR